MPLLKASSRDKIDSTVQKRFQLIGKVDELDADGLIEFNEQVDVTIRPLIAPRKRPEHGEGFDRKAREQLGSP